MKRFKQEQPYIKEFKIKRALDKYIDTHYIPLSFEFLSTKDLKEKCHNVLIDCTDIQLNRYDQLREDPDKLYSEVKSKVHKYI